MEVGESKNLSPYTEDSGTFQSIPFINQGSGCGNGTNQVDTGSVCKLKSIRGNSVVVNQLFDISESASASVSGVSIITISLNMSRKSSKNKAIEGDYSPSMVSI